MRTEGKCHQVQGRISNVESWNSGIVVGVRDSRHWRRQWRRNVNILPIVAAQP